MVFRKYCNEGNVYWVVGEAHRWESMLVAYQHFLVERGRHCQYMFDFSDDDAFYKQSIEINWLHLGSWVDHQGYPLFGDVSFMRCLAILIEYVLHGITGVHYIGEIQVAFSSPNHQGAYVGRAV